MTTSGRSVVDDESPATKSLGVAGIGLLAALIYVVVVGGTGSGELHPVLRVLNAGLAAALIATYVVRAPDRADRLDRVMLLALVLFATAGVLSQYLRQSLDAVLAATAYVAAFFIAREQLARPPVRRAFIRVLVGLSATFTIGASALWVPQLIEWWTLADRAVLPPLDLPLSAGPWGYRYDVALLIALLYPAWWIDRPSLLRRMAGIAVGLVGLVVIVITGSRTTWLSITIASAAMGLPIVVQLWRRNPRARIPATLLVTLIGAGAIVTGAATPLTERLLAFASLDWRLAMWGPLTELWLAHPLSGIGPGAFPWALQLTSYFDTRSWAPRHPDNAVFQVLPEAGLLGLAAMLLVAVSLLVAVFRGRSTAARWVAVVVIVTSLGSNPTDFAFLLAIGIAWATYAAPRNPAPMPAEGSRRSRLLAGSLVAVVVIFVAHASTLVAAFAYEEARSAVSGGKLADAGGALRVAMAFDPGMALYHRQHGTLAYLEADPVRAVADLERAVALNRSDDLAWRMLALAHHANGQADAARDAALRAVAVQRSDVTNLLLEARMAVEESRSDDAATLLAEIVQSWPTAVAAPGWRDVLPDSVSTVDILDDAAERWLRGAPTPELAFDQGIWLGVLAGRPDVLDAAIERMGDEGLARTLASVIACDVGAGSMVNDATAAQRRSHMYWQLRVRASVLAGDIDLRALQALQIMAGGSYSAAAAEGVLNPLDENTGLSADRWGYRRYPIHWPHGAVTLPSVHAGAALWMFDPRSAVDAAGLGDRLRQC